MQLERIAAVVRPRRPWEAVDLGFMMARAWWWPILRSWLAIVAPFCLAVTLALYAAPRWALAVVWWAKPLYDRVPLYVLSRALFGSVPPVAEVRGKMPRLWLERILSALVWRRLDPMRSFLMPVESLEGVTGAERRERAAVLKRGEDGSAASWLTVACLTFELGTLAALVGLVDFLRPQEMAAAPLWEIFTFLGNADAPRWYAWLTIALYFLAMTLLEPFYVAGGFALYLNRRTQLEGWDVELAFRRLARRLRRPPGRRAAALLAMAGALAFASPPASAAEPTPARDPQQAVKEILADPEFGSRRTATVWRLRDVPEGAGEAADASAGYLESLAALLAAGLKVVLWAALVAALAVLAVVGWRRFYRPSVRPDDAEAAAGPRVVAGFDVTAALPDDVVGEALARWRAGRLDEALSLLYRGALCRLVDRRHLPVQESWTEGDCLRHLRGPSSPVPPRSPLVDYFARLTAVWQRTAYAHRPPTDDEMRELSSGWSVHFGVRP